MMPFMRTTIDIKDAILDALKERAHLEKRPMTKVVNDVLEKGLAAPTKQTKKVRLKTYGLGIRPAFRGMSLNQVYDQLETEDHLRVAEE